MSDGDLVVVSEGAGLELEVKAPQLGPAELVDLWLRGQPSPNTRRTYRAALRAFCESCGADVEVTVSGLLRDRREAHALVAAYKGRMLEEGRSSATVNLRLAALRSLTSFAEELGVIAWNLKTRGVPQEKYRDTRGCGKGGFLQLLQAARHPRDKAIVWLLYGLALRRSEVVSLDLEHVDVGGARLWVLRKGKRERKPKTLAPSIVASLRAWIEVRGEEPGALFFNLDRAHERSRLTDGGVYDLLKRLGKRAGVRRSHPHGLRHASITEALRLSNGNIYAAQAFADHGDPKTTGLYLDNLEDKGGEMSALVVADAALEVPS